MFIIYLSCRLRLAVLLASLTSAPLTSPSPTASQAPTGDLTNWKTYIHDIYNYSFKYPLDWKVENLGEAGPKIVDLVALNPTIKDYGPHAITISFTSQNYQELVENVEIQASRIILDGVEGIKTKETWGDGSVHTTILLPYGKIIGNTNTIIILAEMKYGEIFDQILSTFKFLD